MEEDKKSLEEKAKEFFKSEIYPNFNGIHPVKIENFEEKLPLINYLSENKLKPFVILQLMKGRSGLRFRQEPMRDKKLKFLARTSIQVLMRRESLQFYQFLLL
jgi:hypothetical protein